MYSMLLNILIDMNRKDLITFIIKVLIYILTLILGALGASSLSSCTSTTPLIRHTGTIILNDTLKIRYGY